ncbi:hypothetical protein CDD83_436 [Cordyceps sp. RAO-2017]|nr:hypothetical protein CDD83_436 [Cordyceps sp. RAO-2017]
MRPAPPLPPRIPLLKRLPRLSMLALVALYSLLNLVLAVLSAVSAQPLADRAHDAGCLVGDARCGSTCSVISAGAARALWLLPAGAAFDPLHLFRATAFTLAILLLLLAAGWSTPALVGRDRHLALFHLIRLAECHRLAGLDSQDAFALAATLGCSAAVHEPGPDLDTTRTFAGLGGAFVLQHADAHSSLATVTYGLAHFNAFLGAFIAGVSLFQRPAVVDVAHVPPDAVLPADAVSAAAPSVSRAV